MSNSRIQAGGIGLATIAADGSVLDTWYPAPYLGASGGNNIPGVFDALSDNFPQQASGTRILDPQTAEKLLGIDSRSQLGPDRYRPVDIVPVVTVINDLSTPAHDTHDVFLRLHLLSHRLVAPNGLNTENFFGLLSTVVWTSIGPCPVQNFNDIRMKLRSQAITPTVWGIDKFPRMVDYVIPAGVRIADADRVRLGAHLAPGTTVMHEGFVNFNAGTLGSCMVEGRISAGVVVGDGSDIGGGASIMGTLSGGGKNVISIGTGCLLGANSGLGISLGDNCIIEAGCYVTAGTKITVPDGTVRAARDLSGISNVLFRRNSLSGAMEVINRDSQTAPWQGLNSALHANT